MYTYYQCDTCKKNIKRVVDHKRPFLSGCTITENCRGTLRQVQKHQTNNVELSIETWKSRFDNSSKTTNTSVDESRFNLMSGDHILTMLSKTNSPFIQIKLQKFTLTNADVSEYVYRRNKDPGYVSGPDDSAFGKILRFTSNDNITVTVNGVVIPADKIDVSMLNTILISNGVVDNNSEIKVYVSKMQEAVYKYVTFFRNTLIDAKLLSSAWKNIDFTMQGADRYYVYHAINFDELDVNANYTLVEITDNNSSHVTDGKFALATKPYSTYDRSLTSTVKISSILDGTMIKYENNDKNEIEFSVPIGSISSVLPPFSFSTVDQDSSYFIVDDDITLVGTANELQVIKNPYMR